MSEVIQGACSNMFARVMISRVLAGKRTKVERPWGNAPVLAVKVPPIFHSGATPRPILSQALGSA